VNALAVRIEGFVKRMDKEASKRDFFENFPSDEHRLTELANEKPGERIGDHLDPKEV
jgi:hypothetical protein